jgi:hypothetical protein
LDYFDYLEHRPRRIYEIQEIQQPNPSLVSNLDSQNQLTKTNPKSQISSPSNQEDEFEVEELTSDPETVKANYYNISQLAHTNTFRFC